MKNKIICIIVCIFVIVSIMPMVLSTNKSENDEFTIYYQNDDYNKFLLYHRNLDILDQQQTYDSGYAHGVGGEALLAQSFIPSLGLITRIELKIFRAGVPNGLKISIRNDLNGEDLTSIYIDAINISTTPHWHEFDFDDVGVTPGESYYIIWDPDGSIDQDNTFYWKLGNDNPYVYGESWKYLGMFWEPLNISFIEDPDFCFKTYGGMNNPPDVPNTPTGVDNGFVDIEYGYFTSTIDSDDDWIAYRFDFGNRLTDWTMYTASGIGNTVTNIWSVAGTYQVKAQAKDLHGSISEWSSPLSVTISSGENNPPDKPETPSGATSGKTGTSYSYSTSTLDSEGDDVYYWFDWGDGTNSGWDGPHNSGDIINLSHTWSADGTYPIKVKAKDINGAESEWSDPLEVSMPKSINIFNNNISIEFKGGFGLKIIITNNGVTTIPLGEIIFSIDAPWLILGGETTTTISDIPPGAEDIITIGLLFGFGQFDATVNILDISETRSGFILGPFVILY